MEELQNLQEQISSLEPEESSRRRSRIHRMLARLAPGRATTLAAVSRPDGTVSTNLHETAQLIRNRRRAVFTARPRDGHLRQRLLSELAAGMPTLPGQENPGWRERRRDVRRAVDAAPSSAAEPDGIPFVAWKRLGLLAVDILHGALKSVMQEGAVDAVERDFGPDFNASPLVFIPKKPAGHTGECAPFFPPLDSRPINIVNCENRIFASAVRLRLEP
jgi:hypothetical protein